MSDAEALNFRPQVQWHGCDLTGVLNTVACKRKSTDYHVGVADCFNLIHVIVFNDRVKQRVQVVEQCDDLQKEKKSTFTPITRLINDWDSWRVPMLLIAYSADFSVGLKAAFANRFWRHSRVVTGTAETQFAFRVSQRFQCYDTLLLRHSESFFECTQNHSRMTFSHCPMQAKFNINHASLANSHAALNYFYQ